MQYPHFLQLCIIALRGCVALSVGYRSDSLIKTNLEKMKPLQNIITWDEKSLLIHGERVMIWSGEVHPFRLPVPSLWLDVFQKIKALGFNAVSFYVYWALLEGKQGRFSAEGIFDLEPFFQAATETGIYLIARPGPYINAEVAGGGFPGWIQRVNSTLRTSAPEFEAATDNYLSHIYKIIAKAQITNGGPIILLQPDNEFTYSARGFYHPPDPAFMQYVEDKAHQAGIVVPIIGNDAWAAGRFVPGSGKGEWDIYAYDQYPFGFECNDPQGWPTISADTGSSTLTTDLYSSHMRQSPSTPFSILEFQGGGSPPWGGSSYDQCALKTNQEFERVFYKNLLASRIAIFNIYMIFGGTSWGYISYAGGYSSYDYGAAIEEDGRTLVREKYSELKTQAQFIKVSPGYLEATPGNMTAGVYSQNTDVTVTPMTGNGTGSFFVARHTDYSNLNSTNYTLQLPLSSGNVSIPQLGGSLTLNGRDSKIHVADYPIGDIMLRYSTAEIFTWKQFEDKKVLIVYGGSSELHEMAILTLSNPLLVEGTGVKIERFGTTAIMQWKTSSSRSIVQIDDLFVYILDRVSAYDYWVPDLLADKKMVSNSTALQGQASVIINGAYLVRSVSIDKNCLFIKADFNSSSTMEIIGVPKSVSKLVVNDGEINFSTASDGSWVAQIQYTPVEFRIPVLSSLNWKYMDSLPEIQPSYDDSQWPAADHAYTNNTLAPLRTPVSLYGSDYGFHSGVLIFRGHFIASGSESLLNISTMGGSAFASSVFLNNTFLGSWPGDVATSIKASNYKVPKLYPGESYVLTVLVDNNGNDANWLLDSDSMKNPRGIIDYSLSSQTGSVTPLTWKITGNLGGEDYMDQERGPLNEGGLFAERQGYHLPRPPLCKFKVGSPFDGIEKPGVAFYTAPLELDYPSQKYDIPITFNFENNTEVSGKYRAILIVNGFTFGKYISHIGPQTSYPVPEGILNYGGENWIGLVLWSIEPGWAKVPNLTLSVKNPVMTGRKPVEVVNAGCWDRRQLAY